MTHLNKYLVKLMSNDEALLRNYESQLNVKEKEIETLEKKIRAYGFSDCETRNDFQFKKIKLGIELDEVKEEILKAGSRHDRASVIALKGKEGGLKLKITDINSILVLFDKITPLESAIIDLEEKIQDLDNKIKSRQKERKQMDDVLKALRNYQTCQSAAKSANVDEKRIVNWIHEGRDGFDENKVYFYKEYSKIKSNKNNKMFQLLKHLRSGKTRLDACKSVNISVDVFNKWYNYGKSGKGKKNIDFYNKVKQIEEDNENKKQRLLMEKFLGEYNKTRNLNKSLQSAGISQSLYHSWCRDGRNHINANTIYFVSELDKINKSKPKKPKITKPKDFKPVSPKVSKPKSGINVDTKREKLEMDSFLDMYRRTGSFSRSLQSAGISQDQYHSWRRDGRKRVSSNTIYFVSELDKINKSKPKEPKITKPVPTKKPKPKSEIKGNIISEKRVMNSFLNKYRSTRSLSRSLQSAGISQSQYHSWCRDGRNRVSNNAIYFVSELDKINKSKPKIPKVSKPVSPKVSKPKSGINLDVKRERLEMDSFLDMYRRTGSLSRSLQSAGISQSLYHSWCRDGRNRVSSNTIYFVNELDRANKKYMPVKTPEPSRPKPKNKVDVRREKLTMDSFLDMYRRTGSLSRSLQGAGISQSQYESWCRDGENRLDKNSIYFVKKLNKISKSKPLQPKTPKINQGLIVDINKEKLVMDIFLDKYRRTRSLSKSLQSAGISESHFYSWCNKGRRHTSKNTIYFVREYDKIRMIPTETPKSDTTETNHLQKEKMNKIIDLMLDGKTRAQAANSVSISINTVNKWYKDGMNAKNGDVIKFYHEVRDIESYVKDNTFEKKRMISVLNYLKQGKTIKEAASYANVDVTMIKIWCKKGKNRSNPNAIYFYRNFKEIEIKEDPKRIVSFEERQRIKMDKILNQMKLGKTRIEAAKIANIPYMTVNNWYSQGRNSHCDNTIYFYNEINSIERSDNKKEREEMDLVLDELNKGKALNDVIEQENIALDKLNKWLDDGKNNLNEDSIYFYREYMKIKSHSELQSMGKFLEAKKSGKDNMESCKYAGITLSKLNNWLDQGKSKKSSHTIHFVEEYDKLNSIIEEDNSIPIKKSKKIYCPKCNGKIEKGNNFCRYCGHKLVKEKKKTSIFGRIRSLF